jgi:hypothetical protein
LNKRLIKDKVMGNGMAASSNQRLRHAMRDFGGLPPVFQLDEVTRVLAPKPATNVVDGSSNCNAVDVTGHPRDRWTFRLESASVPVEDYMLERGRQ